MAENSALPFLQKRAKDREWSVFEHAAVIFNPDKIKFDLLPEETPEFGLVMSRAVLGDVRCSDVVQYCSKYRDNIEGLEELPRSKDTYTFIVTCSRATSQQMERHRNFSFCERSLRYVKLEDFAICVPKKDDLDIEFTMACENAYSVYSDLLRKGWSPDNARKVLPLCTETEVCVTAHLTWWYDMFSKRYHTKASNEFIKICQLIYKEMPEFFKERAEKTGLIEQFRKADTYIGYSEDGEIQ